MTTRALVLGGGGVTGIGWELGVLVGLADQGIDLSDADLVVGTSAGSVVGGQLTAGVPLEDLYAHELRPAGGEPVPRLSAGALARMAAAYVRHWRAPERARAAVGRMAVAARTEQTEAQRREVIAARLPVHDWPATRLLVAAVDATSGEFTAFEAGSGVTLVDAVAASCAVPLVSPVITADGRQWIDGGARSPVNADLAVGCDRVVVLAPIPRGAGPIGGLSGEVAQLLAAGARVASVTPDAAARAAIGRNVLDPRRRAGSARAGREQAAAVAGAVRAVWS